MKTNDTRIRCAFCHGTYYLRLGKCPTCQAAPRPRDFPDLTRTTKMLAWYNRQEPRRQRLLDGANTSDKALEALKLWENHERAVRHAFWLDTRDRNSRDNCMLVDISWLCKICKEHAERKRLKRRVRETPPKDGTPPSVYERAWPHSCQPNLLPEQRLTLGEAYKMKLI